MALIHSLVFMQDRIFFEDKMDLVHRLLKKEIPKPLEAVYETAEEDEPMPFASSFDQEEVTDSVF